MIVKNEFVSWKVNLHKKSNATVTICGNSVGAFWVYVCMLLHTSPQMHLKEKGVAVSGLTGIATPEMSSVSLLSDVLTETIGIVKQHYGSSLVWNCCVNFVAGNPEHGILSECYQNVTRMLPDYYQNVTKILPECYQNDTRILPECYQNVTRILPDVTRMLPECYQNVTWILSCKKNSSYTFCFDRVMPVDRCKFR